MAYRYKHRFRKMFYRSRHGEILGVCQGLADWRELPVGPVRLLLIVIAVSTGIFPVLILYIIAGILLPLEPSHRDFSDMEHDEDIKDHYHRNQHHTVNDIKDKFDDLKERVSKMEDDVFDREKDWDQKFDSSE